MEEQNFVWNILTLGKRIKWKNIILSGIFLHLEKGLNGGTNFCLNILKLGKG